MIRIYKLRYSMSRNEVLISFNLAVQINVSICHSKFMLIPKFAFVSIGFRNSIHDHNNHMSPFVIFAHKFNFAMFFKFLRTLLKWYYDQNITFIFSSNFETLFTKHSPSEILSLNFDKKTVYLNCNFPI